MTTDDFGFLYLCCKYCVDPTVALEHDGIVQALREDNATECERILKEEF